MKEFHFLLFMSNAHILVNSASKKIICAIIILFYPFSIPLATLTQHGAAKNSLIIQKLARGRVEMLDKQKFWARWERSWKNMNFNNDWGGVLLWWILSEYFIRNSRIKFTAWGHGGRRKCVKRKNIKNEKSMSLVWFKMQFFPSLSLFFLSIRQRWCERVCKFIIYHFLLCLRHHCEEKTGVIERKENDDA